MTRDRFQSFTTLLLVGAILLTWGALAQAQTATRVTPCSATTANNELCVTWGAVTTRTDGLPTTFPVTYRLEQQIGTGAFATVSTGSTTQYYAKALAPGNYTYRIYAIENAIVSDASAPASKAVTQAPPSVPVIIIAATIYADGPPTYRVIQQVTLKPNEVVFAAPASMRPLFANR